MSSRKPAVNEEPPRTTPPLMDPDPKTDPKAVDTDDAEIELPKDDAFKKKRIQSLAKLDCGICVKALIRVRFGCLILVPAGRLTPAKGGRSLPFESGLRVPHIKAWRTPDQSSIAFVTGSNCRRVAQRLSAHTRRTQLPLTSLREKENLRSAASRALIQANQ
jgi:hypothetical protein